MKNYSIISSVIFALAIGYLYYLHFHQANTQATFQPDKSVLIPAVGDGKIYFVNTDTLLEHYEYFKKQKTEFENKQERVRAELKSEGDRLQSEVESYQQKGAGMSEIQRQQMEEQLMAKQQKLMQKKESLMAQLDSDQDKSSEELFSRVAAYMKKVNQGSAVHYVLGRQRGSGILYANDSLDITFKVIQGLNADYAKDK